MRKLKYGISIAVGRKHDRRWKLSPQEIRAIRREYKPWVYGVEKLAKKYHVATSTIIYWVNPRFRAKQRAKNAKRPYRKEYLPRHYENRWRRLGLVWNKYLEYQERQRKSLRKLYPERYKEYYRRYIKRKKLGLV